MTSEKQTSGDFPAGPVIKTSAPNAEGLGSISGQGAQSCTPQQKVCMLRPGGTKTQSSQIN